LVEALDLSSWTKTIDEIAKDLHNGKLKPADLHPDLISKTYNELEKGAAEGYGKSWLKIDTANTKTVQQLKQNIYRFSGAKTYQQLAEMNSFLVDSTGKIRTYSEFKRKIDVVHQKYNRNYLQAEYQTAKRSAQAARQWKGFEDNKDLFPNLKYMTVDDDKVRHDHEKLHGIIKPVDHNFWNTHYPPNGWRCRCYVKQTTEASNSIKVTTDPDKGFGLNVGKTNNVFNENEHPYFTFPAGDATAVKKAFENFKLIAPYGKARFIAANGSKVFVSPFADAKPRELIGNYKVAVKIAEQLNKTVKLAPHVDGTLLLKKTNAEYLINGKIADRKSPVGKNLRTILRKASQQNVEVLVIDLQNSSLTIEETKTALAKNFKLDTNYSSIKEVIFVSKNRKVITHYKRSAIKKSKK
jgi:SPP1 gp7 family putative phage head morphogenesis protein